MSDPTVVTPDRPRRPAIYGYHCGSGIRVLTVPSKVDGEAVDALAAALDAAALDGECAALILDLDAALTTMSTAATSALCRVLRRAEHGSPRFAVVCSHPTLRHILHLASTGVEIHQSLIAALALLRTQIHAER